jgi:hypothetical protein
MMRMSTWNSIIQLVLAKSAHEDLLVHKSMVQHPSSEGFTLRLGDFQGQLADYGKALSDGKGIHIREYADKYVVHWDHADPSVDPVGHLIYDAGHWLVIGGIAVSIALLGLFAWLSDS